jgi:integrase
MKGIPNKSLKLALDSLARARLDNRSKLVISLFLECSCKVSEIVNIKAGEIYKNKILIGKREVSISENLYSSLIKFISENKISRNDYLLSTRQSEKISTKRIRQIIQSNTEKILGFKINPENLRKLSISEKLKEKDVKEVKEEVGLKRLDKRKYLSLKEVGVLRDNIEDERTFLIFELLLNGLKSKEIIHLKVEDILGLNISSRMINRLESFISKNKVSFGEYIFLTRQNSHLTKERIFQIINDLGKVFEIEVTPRILNNTALSTALFSKDSESKLNALGVKTRAFHLHGGFVEND